MSTNRQEYLYFDKNGKPSDAEHGSLLVIREIAPDGKIIGETEVEIYDDDEEK